MWKISLRRNFPDEKSLWSELSGTSSKYGDPCFRAGSLEYRPNLGYYQTYGFYIHFPGSLLTGCLKCFPHKWLNSISIKCIDIAENERFRMQGWPVSENLGVR